MAARTKFTPENRAVIIDRVRSGATFADACRELEIREKTAQGWLTRGRREKEGEYVDFAAAVEDARATHQRAILSRVEYDKHLAKAVRAGSVQAMKLWWDIHGKGKEEDGADASSNQDPADPFEALEAEDELAKVRARKAS